MKIQTVLRTSIQFQEKKKASDRQHLSDTIQVVVGGAVGTSSRGGWGGEYRKREQSAKLDRFRYFCWYDDNLV